MSQPNAIPLLEAQSLSIGYGQCAVAEDITAQVHAGEFVCLLGPNGCGKSTLLRTLSGMQRALAGDLQLQGEVIDSIPPRQLAKRISVVLTEPATTGMMDVHSLVAIGRHPYSGWLGGLTETDRQCIQKALEISGATTLVGRQVSELSDGERQKVLVARALAQEAKVMLLDEPTAYLDLPRRVELMGLLRELARQQEMAILLSTHDLELALSYADSIWLLGADGALHQGTPQRLIDEGCFPKAFGETKINWEQLLSAYRAQSGQVPE